MVTVPAPAPRNWAMSPLLNVAPVQLLESGLVHVASPLVVPSHVTVAAFTTGTSRQKAATARTSNIAFFIIELTEADRRWFFGPSPLTSQRSRWEGNGSVAADAPTVKNDVGRPACSGESHTEAGPPPVSQLELPQARGNAWLSEVGSRPAAHLLRSAQTVSLLGASSDGRGFSSKARASEGLVNAEP